MNDDDIYDDFTINTTNYYNDIIPNTIQYNTSFYNYINPINTTNIYTYINNMLYEHTLSDEQCERMIEYLSAFR
jgi:hypothetical protein